jgi:hypothetical protein
MRHPTPPPPDPVELELLGQMHYCPSCSSWWPEDDEFFYRDKNGKCNAPCKACQVESRQKLEGLPCCVKGCQQPRKSIKDARCVQHSREHYYARKAQRKSMEAQTT